MTAVEIAETLAMPLSTVSAVLRRNGLGRLGRVGLEPAVRCERSRRVSSCTSMSRSCRVRALALAPRVPQLEQRRGQRSGDC
jgi:hypothetical protein